MATYTLQTSITNIVYLSKCVQKGGNLFVRKWVITADDYWTYPGEWDKMKLSKSMLKKARTFLTIELDKPVIF